MGKFHYSQLHIQHRLILHIYLFILLRLDIFNFRWRRFHNRAKLEDLKETLILVNRHDILNDIENTLDPPSERIDVSDDLYSHIDPYMVPFVKEVERFDELRAANRI